MRGSRRPTNAVGGSIASRDGRAAGAWARRRASGRSSPAVGSPAGVQPPRARHAPEGVEAAVLERRTGRPRRALAPSRTRGPRPCRRDPRSGRRCARPRRRPRRRAARTRRCARPPASARPISPGTAAPSARAGVDRGARGLGEQHRAVAHDLHDLEAVLGGVGAHERCVAVQQLAPAAVADRDHGLGRADEVAEQDRPHRAHRLGGRRRRGGGATVGASSSRIR